MSYKLVVPASVKAQIADYLHYPARFPDDAQLAAAAIAIRGKLEAIERTPTLGARVADPFPTLRKHVFTISLVGIDRHIAITYCYNEDASTGAPLILTSFKAVAM